MKLGGGVKGLRMGEFKVLGKIGRRENGERQLIDKHLNKEKGICGERGKQAAAGGKDRV